MVMSHLLINIYDDDRAGHLPRYFLLRSNAFSFSGVYKVPHSPPLGGGGSYQILGEEFQVVKRGR